jgi:hypothetical protein
MNNINSDLIYDGKIQKKIASIITAGKATSTFNSLLMM